jgi:hypothetical protein
MASFTSVSAMTQEDKMLKTKEALTCFDSRILSLLNKEFVDRLLYFLTVSVIFCNEMTYNFKCLLTYQQHIRLKNSRGRTTFILTRNILRGLLLRWLSEVGIQTFQSLCSDTNYPRDLSPICKSTIGQSADNNVSS